MPAAAAAAGVPGAATSHAAAAASLAASTQANAAAAAAAGLGPHSLLFDPAFLTAAGLAAAGSPGQVLQQHHTQLQAAATQTQAQRHHAHVAPPNAMGHTLILPAAINPHPAAISKKRSLGSGIVMNEIAPSVVSLATSPLPEATNKRQRGSGSGQSRKVKYAEEAFKAEDPTEKRRHERNLREQQRSSKISSQIKELREVLSDCNVPFKPNKFSILLKVVEYIKQLQSRAIMLDAEHQKLITTVRQTNEMVTNSADNNNVMSSTTCADNESSDTTCQDAWQQGGDRMNAHPSRGARGESELFFVKGIDYRSVFEQCPTAFGIAALDGRILECNVEFQNILGYSSREDLWKQSLFNLVHNHQDIFRAMAQMLKTAEEPTPKSASASSSGANGAGNNSMDRFWTGPVTSKRNIKVSFFVRQVSVLPLCCSDPHD
jgi:PAS domain-containing protein